MPDLDVVSILVVLSYAAIPVLLAITLHEVAHGWVARQFGDPTAHLAGRLTLNPLRHVDPIGTVAVPLVLLFLSLPVLGWAEPVPVSFVNLLSPLRVLIPVG